MNLGNDEARFWAAPDWPGVELMRARWRRHRFPEHAHDCYTIGVNLAGGGVFDCRGGARAARPGTLNLIGPGEAHTGSVARGEVWSYFDFYVSAERMHALAGHPDAAEPPVFAAPSVRDPGLARRLTHAFRAITEGPCSRLERESLLVGAFAELFARHAAAPRAGDSPTPHGVRPSARVREFLREHFAEEIPIAALARLAEWSPYHLIRAFRRDFGLTPHAYQRVLRVAAAQDLVRRGTPLVEVAGACGFCDQSHMHRVFRRMLGTTPGRYARAAIPSKI